MKCISNIIFNTRVYMHSNLIKFEENCKAKILIYLNDIQCEAENVSLRSIKSHSGYVANLLCENFEFKIQYFSIHFNQTFLTGNDSKTYFWGVLTLIYFYVRFIKCFMILSFKSLQNYFIKSINYIQIKFF